MDTATERLPVTSPPGRALYVRGRRYPVVLPKPTDPRLRQSAVLLTVQLLGQVTLGFNLSVAQLLISLGTCAVLEVVITFWRRRILAWPASALLTGNGVALILRVPGTVHGDWWSLRGWWTFAGCAALSLGSKYVIRADGRHVFNPSNIGLVVVFLVLGETRADPQPLWWGDMHLGLGVTFAVILVGGVVVLGRIGLFPMAAAFWLTFASLSGLLAASGHCMTAPWQAGAVCGGSFWWVLVTSPEVAIFALFMITDPRTTPSSARARLGFGTAVGVLAAVAIAPARTEFATKVALLGALVVVCAAVAVGRAWAKWEVFENRLPAASPGRFSGWLTGAALLAAVGLAAPVVVAAGSGARPDSFVGYATQLPAPEPAVPANPELPPVELAPDLDRVDASFSQGAAERMATDLLADLDVMADALARGDSEAMGIGGAGAYRDDARRHVADATLAGQAEVPRYAFSLVRAVRVKVPGSTQNAPEIGLEVTGTVTYWALPVPGPALPTDGSVPPNVRATRSEEYHALFRLAPNLAGDRFLIAGPGETWVDPP